MWSAEFAATPGKPDEKADVQSLPQSHWIRDSEVGLSHQWFKKPLGIWSSLLHGEDYQTFLYSSKDLE